MIDTSRSPWRVRIGRPGGPVVGAGVLVHPTAVLTCAHVVAEAVGADPAGPAPAGPVDVDFPTSRAAAVPGRLAPDGWRGVRERDGDLALLTIPPAPEGTAPARFATCAELAPGTPVRAYGFPRGLPDGLWRSAVLAGPGGPGVGWIQVDPVGAPMPHGFSGAGALADRGVVGLLVARYRGDAGSVNWLVPAEHIATCFPAVLASPGATDREPSTSELQRLARVLIEVPAMRHPDSRQQVIDALPPTVANQVPRQPTPMLEAFALLRTCLSYRGGLSHLVAVLDGFDSDASALHRMKSMLEELGLQGR